MSQFNYDSGRDAGFDEIVKGAGSSIGSVAVRVVIDDENAGSKAEAIKQLDVIRAKIVADTWPPA